MSNLVIEINEFQAELMQCINKAASVRGIPFVVIEPIMKDMTIQVQSTARAEFEQAKLAQAKQKEVKKDACASV